MVITLGDGFGTAIYSDGHIRPNLELSHHLFHRGDASARRANLRDPRIPAASRWTNLR
jgi:hypothetical protein